MRIGIDFDNTIVSYDALFHRVGRERQLIPPSLPPTKLHVREYLKQQGQEALWTEMQGYVYGARMAEAVAYPGAIEFLAWASARRIALSIVSHKTRHPFLGERYDLQAAARRWVDEALASGPAPLIDASDVYFELTKEDKIRRIASLELDYFIDDLPEILLADGFPAGTTRILFAPEGNSGCGKHQLVAYSTWREIQSYFEAL